ncbi:MAG: hypothetical protein ABIV51_14100 [Saprospiraceae bacterium]
MNRNLFSVFMLSFTVIFTLLISQSAIAQRPSPDQDLQRLKLLYRLDDKQTQKVNKVLVRREKQLAEVQGLRDANTIRVKKQNIFKGAEAAFSQILYPSQYQIFQDEQVRLRKARGQRTMELKKQGNSETSIQDQINEFEF